MKKILHNSITKRLIISFLIAIIWSIPLYTLYFGIESKLLNTAVAPIAIYLLLVSPATVWLFSGLFIGVFWFWWIGLSFIHYHLPWMVIPIDITISLVYALLLYFGAWIAEYISKRVQIDRVDIIFKAIYLALLPDIHPFGFDWFRPQILFAISYWGVTNMDYYIIITSLAINIILAKSYPKLRYLPLILMLSAMDIETPKISYSQNSDKIYIAHTDVPIEKKWNPDYIKPQLRGVFTQIDRAIDRGYRAIILPESVIPLFLNREPILMDMLKSRSKYIDIVVGALYLDGDIHRNSAYIFREGNYTVADKSVLVPFGESNPLPYWLSGIVNRIFFDGAPDYKPAKKPTDIDLEGKRFRVAICYEGTSEQIYFGNIKNIIVISNNAWFTPSIEPTLQKLLMVYLSKKYRVDIYHSVNGSKSFKVDME